MIGGEPQLATPTPGATSNGRGSPAFAPRLSPTTYLFGAAALYSILALGWSVAGREDFGNARTASLTAVISLAVTLAAVVANAGGVAERDTLYGWISLGIGVALFAAAEIARLSVIWTEKVVIWRPDSLAWLQAAGALGLLAGVLQLLAGVSGDRARVASAAGLTAFGLALTSPFVVGGRLALEGEPPSWSTLAPLIGIAFSVVAAAVGFDIWRSRNDETDLSAAGLTLFAAFVSISIALQTLGSWDESSGLMALGRWVIPVAALGATSAVIDQGHCRSMLDDINEQRWSRWPAAGGLWPIAAAGCVVTAAVVALSVHASVGADLAAIASLSVLLLFARQALSLQIARSHAATLRVSAEELQRLANVDMLTALPNRAALDARLAEEFERAFRYEQPMSLLFIDVDHFKRINDFLGHSTGDAVLRQVAESLRLTARSIDFVGRYGGEEFLVIAPGTWTADAMILAERLRDHVQRVMLPRREGESEAVTISIGIAGYPEHAEDVSAMLERADQALYRAKAAGRNRTILFETEADA